MNLTFFTTITLIVIVGCSAFIGGRVPSSRGSSSSGSGSRYGSRGSYGSHGSSSGSSRGSSASRSSHGSHGSSSGSSRGSSISGSSHTNPTSSSYQGHGPGGSYTYPQSKGNVGTGSASTSRGHYAPSYYSSLQHIYVTKYKIQQQPNCRYNDILIGLALYDLVRSHTHPTYFYHDSYYRRSMVSSGKAVEDLTKDDATCFLKIRTIGHDEVVKVPCAIVSTFSTGIDIPSNLNLHNGSSTRKCSSEDQILLNRYGELFYLNNYNSISCANGMIIIEDPLSVKGGIDTTNKECIVAILTDRGVIQNNLDCDILLKYAKMRVPENKLTGVLPRGERR